MSSGRSERFRSLSNPGFRLYFGGQLASMCGTWAQTVALAWLVIDLTGSGTDVGLVTAAQFVPVMLLSAWAGAVADRTDPQRAVVVVQLVLGTGAGVLAVLVITDAVELWMLYALSALQGVALAFDTPTRQSLVGRVVGPADLANALSLNATLVQVARVVGPGLAGVLIETVGIGPCFAINAASYVVVLVAVVAMRVDHRAPAAPGSRRGQVVEGLRVVLGSPPLRLLMMLSLVNAIVGANSTVALPVMVRDEFGGDARILGLVGALFGLGGLVGALATAGRAETTKRLVARLLGVQALALGVCGIPSLAPLAVGATVAGLVGLTMGVTLNASLQLATPPELRGRVIGLYFLVAFGAGAIGGPLIGWLAQTGPYGASFLLSGALCAVVTIALVAHWRDELTTPLIIRWDAAHTFDPAANSTTDVSR